MNKELESMHEQIDAIHKCAVDHSNADVLHAFIDQQELCIDHLADRCKILKADNELSDKELRIAKGKNQQLAAQVERLREAYEAYSETGFSELMEQAFDETPAQALAEHNLAAVSAFVYAAAERFPNGMSGGDLFALEVELRTTNKSGGEA